MIADRRNSPRKEFKNRLHEFKLAATNTVGQASSDTRRSWLGSKIVLTVFPLSLAFLFLVLSYFVLSPAFRVVELLDQFMHWAGVTRCHCDAVDKRKIAEVSRGGAYRVHRLEMLVSKTPRTVRNKQSRAKRLIHIL